MISSSLLILKGKKIRISGPTLSGHIRLSDDLVDRLLTLLWRRIYVR